MRWDLVQMKAGSLGIDYDDMTKKAQEMMAAAPVQPVPKREREESAAEEPAAKVPATGASSSTAIIMFQLFPVTIYYFFFQMASPPCPLPQGGQTCTSVTRPAVPCKIFHTRHRAECDMHRSAESGSILQSGAIMSRMR